MRLKNQLAIITGAARGIGQEFCLALPREGAKVVAADVLSCTDTVTRIEEAGREALGVTTDVASAMSTQELAGHTIERFGRIDMLINNAAVLPSFGPFDQIQESDWDRLMAVNVKGMWHCCKAIVPLMREQHRGKIINISSDTIMGVPMLLHHGTSKGRSSHSPERWLASFRDRNHGQHHHTGVHPDGGDKGNGSRYARSGRVPSPLAIGSSGRP